MRILANVPVLPSSDLARSATFYARLGYQTVRRYPDYLILSCGSAELHLALMPLEPSQNAAGAYLRVSGVDDLAQALGLEAEDKPWGQREFALSDPDDNLLRVGEAISR
jgi:catechol 2,3-dioxygenase-like lactoylglutathione lyase family enzyme